MKKLDRYILLNITAMVLTVLLAFVAIDFISQMISEADIIGKHNYTFGKVLQYLIFQIPLKSFEFFPIALLIGALMGLGRIASSNELTVMQTSGFSRLRIGVLGFLLSFVLGSLMLIITEFVGTDAYKYVEDMRAEALNKIDEVGNNGLWAQDGSRFVYIDNVRASGQLSDIKIYETDVQMAFTQVIEADTAKFSPGNWQLQNGVIKTFSEFSMQQQPFTTLEWKNKLNSDILKLLLSDPHELSIRNLYKFISYQQANNIEPTTFMLVFWQRIFAPLTAGVMFLLALPFVFGSQRSSSQGKKLFLGIVLGIAYYISYSSISNIILLTGVNAIYGAIIPIIVFIGLSLVLLRLRN